MNNFLVTVFDPKNIRINQETKESTPVKVQRPMSIRLELQSTGEVDAYAIMEACRQGKTVKLVIE